MTRTPVIMRDAAYSYKKYVQGTNYRRRWKRSPMPIALRRSATSTCYAWPMARTPPGTPISSRRTDLAQEPRRVLHQGAT